jgi:dUTP pyrophosphatase
MTVSKLDILDVAVKRLPNYEGLELPLNQSAGSSGLDLHAAINGKIILNPGERALVPTGIAISLPRGFEAQVRPRSGLAIKYGLSLLNSPGTIDSDYRGEIKVIVMNHGQDSFVIERGLRIAQMIVGQITPIQFKEVQDLDVTARNEGGFGHTGN